MNPFAHARVRQTSAAGFDALQSVCDRLASFGADVDIEFVDGFLAALAVLPRMPPEADWLPSLAGDAFERAFADPEAAAQALRPLQQRLKVLSIQLDPEALLDDPGLLRLQPCLLAWTDDDRAAMVADGHCSAGEAAGLQTATDWASGFLAGWQAFGPAADDTADAAGDDDLDELLRPLLALTATPDEAAPATPDGTGDVAPVAPAATASAAASRDDLIDDACFAVQDLRVVLLGRVVPPPPRQVAPAPGRNDPCPCGSGRKFKKCHGAADAAAT